MANSPSLPPSRATLAAHQLEQLRTLLAELIPGNAFYSRKFADCGITFDVASLEDFSRRFPFTTKQELVENQLQHPPFGTNLTYPLDRYPRFHQTSGTSGTPLRWLDTAENWEAMMETWAVIFDAAGITNRDRVYFAFSFGPFIGFWLAFESAARRGCLCIPGGGLGSAPRLRAILDNRATVLCCTPTYAIRLGEVAREEKIDLATSQVRTIIVAGEPGGSIPAVRARLQQLWPGARVFDHHGMTEVGPVSYECPAKPGILHVVESAFVAEIINPSEGRPTKLGETGELVLTTLGRIGSPLLRYRTGDLVRAQTGPCACGRGDLALAGGILGRVDDMVIVRGVNIYPTAIEEIIGSLAGVVEYQVRIAQSNALAEMSVQIELTANAPDGTNAAAALEKRFQETLSLRVPVRIVAPGTLPRFEMKAKRWIRE